MPDWLSAGTLVFAGVLVIDVLAVVRAIGRGDDPEGTLAWVFAILAFPGVGGLVYLVLDGPSLRRTRRRRARALLESHRGSGGAERGGFEGPAAAVLRVAQLATGIPATGDSRVELLTETKSTFERLEAALRGAKRSIDAEYYIVKNDETGQRFLEILAERAAQGVEVRFLYDAVGSFGLDRRRVKRICDAGGRCEVFLPFNPLRRRWAVHQRNHRKIVVVDDEIAFTGGMNVGDEYSGQTRRRGRQGFRDGHLLLQGPAVDELRTIFEEDWAFATGEPLQKRRPESRSAPAGTATVALVPSGPDQYLNANSIVHFTALGEARERAWLTSPYFIPDAPTTRALAGAALRGLDVRVLVPARCDVKLVQYAARSYYRHLLQVGVRIFEYEPAMLHAKMVLVDRSLGMVGSANLDVRSFRLNFELSALVRDDGFVAALENAFLGYLERSREVTLDVLRRETTFQRARARVARLASPLL